MCVAFDLTIDEKCLIVEESASVTLRDSFGRVADSESKVRDIFPHTPGSAAPLGRSGWTWTSRTEPWHILYHHASSVVVHRCLRERHTRW